MTTRYPFFLAGEAVRSQRELVVTDKYRFDRVATVSLADRATIDQAIGAAASAAAPFRRWPAISRHDVLQHVVDRLHHRKEEIAQMMTMEVGKPIMAARVEVDRAIDVFRLAGEESLRARDEYLPLDQSPRAAAYDAIMKRVPIGPCSFITPFNFPLNLAAHKVAPAIATGCPFVLKPAPQAPICALILAEILAETDMPIGSFSVLPCDVDDAAALVLDERIKLLSFTGSSAVGWELKARAGKKKVLLELGGNAACIVEPDADLDFAIRRITFGGFYQSGQSCISVQRLLLHESICDAMTSALVAAARELRIGDPRDESTFVGPLISEKDVQRVHEWVCEAARGGARIRCGGHPTPPNEHVFYAPTILENAPPNSKLMQEEVFGPVMTIERYSSLDEACAKVNSGRYGLQAGVFTNDRQRAMYAWNELNVGGVVINDVPSMRLDSMPYGGVKDSGCGREGVRFAMNEMSEPRLMVTNRNAR